MQSETPMHAQNAYWFAGVHVAYVMLFCAAVWLWLKSCGAALTAVPTAICFLPAALCGALAFTSTEDFEQYLMRLGACAMFTPVLLLFWASSDDSQERSMWMVGVAAGVLHLAAFAGSIYYFGTRLTRVPASADVAAVDLETLRARLSAIGGTHAPFDTQVSASGELTASYRFVSGEPRKHLALLTFDAEHHAVRVRERLSENLARPKDESERSMRSFGDKAFDPTRPDANYVSASVAQTTRIKPDRLSAVPLQMAGPSASVPSAFAAELDGEGMLTVLCAVVTRSGWHWQPAFFGD